MCLCVRVCVHIWCVCVCVCHMTGKLEFAVVEFYYFYRWNMRDKSLILNDKELDGKLK